MENTIGQWLVQAGGRMKYSSETPTLDAQVLLAKALGVDRSWIVTHPEYNLRDQQKKLAEDYVQQIEDGIPLPYVLGEWEFYGLRFKVTPQVLIPRSETEILVEDALDWLYRNPQKRRGADVGTGSGCIAISLAVRMKDLEMVGGDISPGALRIAIQNANTYNTAKQIHFYLGDLLAPVHTRFDLICANLPYISEKKVRMLKIWGKEPSVALSGGENGLKYQQKLLCEASKRLVVGGLLLMEMEAGQGEILAHLANYYFPNSRIDILRDLQGYQRVLRVENT